MNGSSLVPLVSGGLKRANLTEVLACEATWMCKWALRTERYKVIVAREPDFYGKPPVEIYDLTKDPHETVNLAQSHEALKNQLVCQLELCVAKSLKDAGKRADPVAAHGSVRDRSLAPSPSFKERLKRILGGTKKH
jgi:arylsulfatase